MAANKKPVPMGWCLTGHHAGVLVGEAIPCPGEVLKDRCSCECHTDPEVRDHYVKVAQDQYDARLRKEGREPGKWTPPKGIEATEVFEKPKLVLRKRKKAKK